MLEARRRVRECHRNGRAPLAGLELWSPCAHTEWWPTGAPRDWSSQEDPEAALAEPSHWDQLAVDVRAHTDRRIPALERDQRARTRRHREEMEQQRSWHVFSTPRARWGKMHSAEHDFGDVLASQEKDVAQYRITSADLQQVVVISLPWYPEKSCPWQIFRLGTGTDELWQFWAAHGSWHGSIDGHLACERRQGKGQENAKARELWCEKGWVLWHVRTPGGPAQEAGGGPWRQTSGRNDASGLVGETIHSFCCERYRWTECENPGWQRRRWTYLPDGLRISSFSETDQRWHTLRCAKTHDWNSWYENCVDDARARRWKCRCRGQSHGREITDPQHGEVGQTRFPFRTKSSRVQSSVRPIFHAGDCPACRNHPRGLSSGKRLHKGDTAWDRKICSRKSETPRSTLRGQRMGAMGTTTIWRLEQTKRPETSSLLEIQRVPWDFATNAPRRKKRLTPTSSLPPVHENQTDDKASSSSCSSSSSSSSTQALSGIPQHAKIQAQGQTNSINKPQTMMGVECSCNAHTDCFADRDSESSAQVDFTGQPSSRTHDTGRAPQAKHPRGEGSQMDVHIMAVAGLTIAGIEDVSSVAKMSKELPDALVDGAEADEMIHAKQKELDRHAEFGVFEIVDILVALGKKRVTTRWELDNRKDGTRARFVARKLQNHVWCLPSRSTSEHRTPSSTIWVSRKRITNVTWNHRLNGRHRRRHWGIRPLRRDGRKRAGTTLGRLHGRTPLREVFWQVWRSTTILCNWALDLVQANFSKKILFKNPDNEQSGHWGMSSSSVSECCTTTRLRSCLTRDTFWVGELQTMANADCSWIRQQKPDDDAARVQPLPWNCWGPEVLVCWSMWRAVRNECLGQRRWKDRQRFRGTPLKRLVRYSAGTQSARTVLKKVGTDDDPQQEFLRVCSVSDWASNVKDNKKSVELENRNRWMSTLFCTTQARARPHSSGESWVPRCSVSQQWVNANRSSFVLHGSGSSDRTFIGQCNRTLHMQTRKVWEPHVICHRKFFWVQQLVKRGVVMVGDCTSAGD